MIKSKSGDIGWRDLLRGRNAAIVVVLGLCVWLHASDSTLVATLNPDIVAELQGGALIGWTVSLYEIGSIVAGTSCGLASLRWGLRAPMAVGACVFALGCLISGLAPSMIVMLIGRLVQGLGGGALVALAFVAIATVFPDRLMPRLVALISLVWGVSSFIGPLIGGIFSDFEFWRGAFLVFAAQAGMSAVAIGAIFPGRNAAGPSAQGGRIPIRRLAVLSAGIVLIGLSGNAGQLSMAVLCLAIGCGLLVAFVKLDGRAHDSRLLPPRPFSLAHPVGAAIVMIVAFGACTISFTVYGPVVLRVVHGLSALSTGYLIALASISWTVAALTVAGVDPRHDAKVIRLGAAMLAVSVVGFALTMAGGPVWLIAIWALLEGAGFGLAWTFITRRANLAAAPADVERVGAALPTIHRGGYAVGAALAGLVANAAGFAVAVNTETALSVAFWVFAAVIPFALLGLVAAWRLTDPAQAPAAIRIHSGS